MNQVVYFLKFKNNVELSVRNICLNSDGSELIYLNKDKNNNMWLRFYGLDPNQANNFDREEPTQIKRLELVKRLKFQQEYLPGVCLTRIGQIRLGLNLKSLVIFDVCNLSLLEYELDGTFKSILLRAEDYLGNVLAFNFTSDQLHLVTVEVASNQIMSHLIKRKNHSGFDFKIRTYKIMECDCHKNMVNKKSIYAGKEASDFDQLLTASFDIFN